MKVPMYLVSSYLGISVISFPPRFDTADICLYRQARCCWSFTDIFTSKTLTKQAFKYKIPIVSILLLY